MNTPQAGRGRPRRVLYAEINEDGTVGGSHQCLLDLVRHLDRERFQPVVVFYQWNSFVKRIEDLGAEVHVWEDERSRERIRSGRFRTARLVAGVAAAIRRRVRFIRRERIELVHLNNSPVPTSEDWLPAARLTGRPVVAHCRAEVRWDDDPLRVWLSGRFDRVIAVSRTVAESLRRAGVPPCRISLVYDGIDVEAVRSSVRTDPSDVRRSLGVPEDAFLVVMIGHLRRWKGQDVFLAALASMTPEDRSKFRAVFAGDANPLELPYAAALRSSVTALGLDGTVRFLGPRDDAPDLMNASDAVVHASTSPEPLGLVVLEGMALGKPVVASRLGGPAETVLPGTGILFDPRRPEDLAENLRLLASDPGLCRSLGERGRARADRFGIHRNVGAIQAIYEEIL